MEKVIKQLIDIYETLDGLSNSNIRNQLKEVIENLKTHDLEETTHMAILELAIETYGVNAQLDMVVEEMSELTKEICKKKRGRDNKAAILEELVDVRIMLDQLQTMCGITPGEFKYIKNLKIERLQVRLNDHE